MGEVQAARETPSNQIQRFLKVRPVYVQTAEVKTKGQCDEVAVYRARYFPQVCV